MKIPIINTFLNIELNIFKIPRLNKLKKELSDYFDSHEVEGIKINKFKLEKEFDTLNIIPEEPYFEGTLSGGDYVNEIREIGKKYGLRNLDFINFCYHK